MSSLVKGTTSTGFDFEYEPERLDDMRVVDLIAEIDAPDATDFQRVAGLSRLVTALLGETQKAALYAHIGQQYGGRVPQEALAAALPEIMAAAGRDAEKNSLSWPT